MKKTETGRMPRAIKWFSNRFTVKGLILMYHSINEWGSDPWSLSVSPSNFAEHLEVLQKYGRPMQLQQYIRKHRFGIIPRNVVLVTLDDGYADNLINAKPLLKRYNIPATVFLTTGYIGLEREFWWDELDKLFLQPGKLPEVLCLKIDGNGYEWALDNGGYYSQEEYLNNRNQRAWDGEPGSRYNLYYSIWQLLRSLPYDKQRKAIDEIITWAGIEPVARSTHRPLNLEEVFELAQGDLIEVGSHTVTHPFLSLHALASQQNEIQGSKEKLEEILGRPVTSFAYPHGDYDERGIGLVRQAGFACACSTASDIVWWHTNRFQLPRVQVEDWNGEEFENKLSGLLNECDNEQ